MFFNVPNGKNTSRFNAETQSYQYRNSRYKDNTEWLLSHLYNGFPYLDRQFL